MNEQVEKRGPGRPPKPKGPPKMVDLEITHYKVFTSAGRLLKGDRHPLPGDEAQGLIDLGHAVEIK